ncbi:MAG: hypothetical protein ACRDKZ_09580 [Actinomycetota bacterium]
MVLATLLAFGLFAASVEAKPHKKKAKPVGTTLYMHGNELVGEVESPPADMVFLPMDAKKPTGSEPKSKQMLNYVRGPNTSCAGNTLFPVWSGDLSGTVKGDLEVSLGAVTTPTTVEVLVWPDVSTLLCDSSTPGAESDDFPKPAAVATIDLLPGMNEAVVKNVKFKAVRSVMVQVTPQFTDPGLIVPSFTRILYDSTEFPTSISFKCIPAKGKSCT